MWLTRSRVAMSPPPSKRGRAGYLRVTSRERSKYKHMGCRLQIMTDKGVVF